ncbi:hypothetical protein JCM8097_006647 [Rhodosporidiobolus ruineniae]
MDKVRLQGDAGVQNQVLHVFKDAIVAAIKQHAEGPGSDDSVQIVSGGSKKRSAASTPSGTPAPKKSSRRPTALPVLDFHFTFTPPNNAADLVDALSKVPEAQTPTLLCPISFDQARDNSKTPHRLYLRHADTNAALVELDPVDPAASSITSSWIQMIAPPPLTKAGKPFKHRARALAARAAPREAKAVAPFGGGGLLDALALLALDSDEGVKLTLGLSVELTHEEQTPGTLFHLNVGVALKPRAFFSAPYSRSRRLLVNRLLPPSPVPNAPREAGIDFFYSSLNRAPRTVDGLPAVPVQPPAAPVETDEERAARLRREAKGKGRAVSPAPDELAAGSSGEGGGGAYEPEDELLFPPGLTVELMPFQARTVRWMLGREGKRVLPRSSSTGDAEQEDSASPVDEDEAEGERPPPQLADVADESLREMRRGPLWEKVKLRVLPRGGGDADGEVEERELWLNRVSMAMSETDPLDPPPSSASSVKGGKGKGKKVGGFKLETTDEEDGDVVIVDAKGKGKGNAKAEDGDVEMLDGAAEEQTQTSKTIVGGFKGHGLLAEEVGLGKTVEVLSLILLNGDKKRRRLPTYYNAVTDSDVQPTGMTLIVCPEAIVAQWAQEIERLTPGLKVLRYDGVKQLKDSDTAAKMAKRYDIVLTTFAVLRKEVAFARKPAQRGLRNKREIRYRRSLLVELDFLRLCMDEAQMVGDSVGPTSETASLISRRFSWAVTSTPLKDRISDLKPLLTFLRVEPIVSGRTGIQRLLEETTSFKRLWNEIGTRTLKSQVTHELTLPQQRRAIVPVDFTAVEKFHYDERYTEALNAIGLGPDGRPRDTGVDRDTGEPLPWIPDKGEMNRWLTLLRQLAIHPQLGGRNKEQLGGRVLRTVEEVYRAMQEQAVSAIQSDQRALLAARVRRAQYIMWREGQEHRFETALALFQAAVEDVDPIIDEVVQEIHAVSKEARKKRKDKSPSATPPDEGIAGALELGFRLEQSAADDHEIMTEKERAVARTLGALRNRLRDLLLVKHSALFFTGHANFNMKKEEEEAAAYAKAEELRQTILQPYENAVTRSQKVLQDVLDSRDNADGELDIGDFEFSFNDKGHGLRGMFIFDDIEATSDIANGYAELIFQYRDMIIQMVKTSVSIGGVENATGEEYEERAALQEKATIYLEAFTVLVAEWSYVVNGSRSALADEYKGEQLAHLRRQEVIPEGAPPPKGVEPDQPIDDVDEAMEAALNAIAGPSRRGRAGADGTDGVEEDEAPEEEQEPEEDDGNKKKGKGKRKPKEKKQKTRFQEKRTADKKKLSYKDFLAPTIESGHSAADVLRYELLVERLEAKGEDREFYEPTPIRHLMKRLKDTADESENDREIAILMRERERLTELIAPLEKVADRLRLELDQLNKSFNTRIQYFAQLQIISDEVADPDMGGPNWHGLEIEIAMLQADEIALKNSIESKQTRRRYLDNLNNPEAEGDDDEERTCPICAEFFSSGVLTNCGHLTCSSCFKRWQATSRTCALCKTPLPAGTYQTVKYRPKAGPAEEEDEDADAASATKPSGYVDSHGVAHDDLEPPPPELSTLDEVELDRIRSVATAAPLSSKSDMIVKHVKHLRTRDPNAKVVIFSAWQEALSLLMEAFTRNGVKFVRLEGATGKGKKEGVVKRFQEDPDVAAFFLHTRSQSAGLNLTVARYVFLIEPLLHPSLELQAVARVHRIGQRHETVVYQFAVKGTVDERVAELRARQGTSLFLPYDSRPDPEQESRLGQVKDRASGEARAQFAKGGKTSDEAIDDEDDIMRVILSATAFRNLQVALLPQRLQQPQNLPPLPADADADVEVNAAASGSGEQHLGHALRADPRNEDEQPALMAAVAAAGRAAMEAEEEGVARLAAAEERAAGGGMEVEEE